MTPRTTTPRTPAPRTTTARAKTSRAKTPRTKTASRAAGADPARAVAAAEEVSNQVTSAQLDAAAASFDLLSVPGRLHLVWLLATGEYDVTTLAELTGANVPAASQQLAKLRAAGIVTARRDGRRQLYQVDDPHVVGVIEQMFSHIAPDGTLAPDTSVPDPRRPPRRPRFSSTS